MLILGIESSCDETAASIIEAGGKAERLLVKSNIVASQIETHALYGGVVPEIASRCHTEAISSVVRRAFDDAGVSCRDIGAVAVTYTPGLIGSLLVGVSFAKSLAFSLGLPLVPVDHIMAHTAAAYLENPSLHAPFMSLVVSGGHTSLYNVHSPIDYDETASTRDDAAGEAFDKVGRLLGLTYPGGAAMDALAAEGFSLRDKGGLELIAFPSPAIHDDTLDWSFSGLKTACVNYIHTLRQRSAIAEDVEIPRSAAVEIAASFTDAVVRGITLKLRLAIEKSSPKAVVLAGGVAANSHLRRAVASLCAELGVDFYTPSTALCSDNAAMVAAQGYFEFLSGKKAPCSLNAFASGEAAHF